MRRPEFIARQAACPSGLLGRLLGRIMALETAEANRVALQLLQISPGDHVLEIGFGHGATVAAIAAAASRGFVAGVDVSAEMLCLASRRNRAGVARGLVELRQGTVADLPYADGCFDKVLSVHTLYFWQEPEHALVEIRRVLKAMGRLVLAWRHDPGAVRSFPESVYRFQDEDGIRRLLQNAGFPDPRIERRASHGAILHFAVALPEEAEP